MTGFEPATPTLARLCATNCATSACFERVRRSMRSTTIVHRSSAPQIPTPRPDLGRSVALIWRQRRGDDSGPSGTESTHLARCSAAWRKGVAHQKFPKLDWNRQVVCGHRAVRGMGLAELSAMMRGLTDRPPWRHGGCAYGCRLGLPCQAALSPVGGDAFGRRRRDGDRCWRFRSRLPCVIMFLVVHR